MKRIAFAVGLIVLVFAVSIWAQTQAPKPDPELKKFDVCLGHWTYEGEYKAGPLGPGSKYTGDVTFQMILGGFFLQQRCAEKGPLGELRTIEIDGYDSVNKNFSYSGFADDGSMYWGVLTVNGNTWTWSAKGLAAGKPYLAKGTNVLAADLMSFIQKGEISTDGKTWVPFFETIWTKVKPAPNTK